MSAANKPLASVPHERAVLNCILQEHDTLTAVADVLRGHEFYELRHATIFAAMLRCRSRGENPDMLSVAEDLKALGKLADVGGPAYLVQLTNGMESVAAISFNIIKYAEVVRGYASRRAAQSSLQAALSEVANLQVPLEQTAQRAASALTAASAPRYGLENGQAVLSEVLDKSDEAQREGKSTRLLPTGIQSLDEHIRGVPLGEVTIICANPAVGKTTLAATMVKAMAQGGSGVDPVVCSYHALEDSRQAIFRRYLAEAANLAIRTLFEPGLTASQMELREQGAEGIHAWAGHIWMDDESPQDAWSVARKIRYAVAAHGVRVAFVDHLLEMVSFEDERRQDERVGEILRVLRDVAKSCGIAVVLLVHMRRPKDESVDYRFQKPLMQLIAGGEHSARIARLIIGLWFPKPPAEPKPRKVPEPKVPKRATLEEAHEAHARWQEEKRVAEAEYNAALAKWRGESENAGATLIASTLKVTEGGQFADIHLKRILHAALVDRFA